MMHSHPVLLGLLWLLIVHCYVGRTETEDKETHQVYSYVYHFQHNGTTSSKDIIQHVLKDPDFGIDPPPGKSIVKTISNGNLRGFFSKGFLPARSQYFSRSLPTIGEIKNVVQNNLRPPVLSPIPKPVVPQPIVNNFNNVNHDVTNGINNAHIRSSPVIRNTFSHTNKAANLLNNPNAIINDFPENFVNNVNIPNIPDERNFADLSRLSTPRIFNNNNAVRKVETFEKDIPNGKIVGKIETVSYNSPPVSNSVSSYQGYSGGYRQSNVEVNQNQRAGGYRSYFKQQFRTVTPEAEYGKNGDFNNQNPVQNLINNGRRWTDSRNVGIPNHNRVISDNNLGNQLQSHIPFGQRVNTNTGYARNNLQNINVHHNNINSQNFNRNERNNQVNHQINNNDPSFNRNFDDYNQNNFNEDNIEKKAMDIINDVNRRITNAHVRLNNVNDRIKVNDVHLPFSWDDDNIDYNVNGQNSWDNRRLPKNNNQFTSNRANLENRRPFSNAHSGPIRNLPNGNAPFNALKATIESLAGKELSVPAVRHNSAVYSPDGSFRNVNGGGVERVYGVDTLVQGPKSFSRNQQSGYERKFEINSDTGYQRTNQWASNNVRRLDIQGTKTDFSKDFIDVFRDDY